MIIASFFLSIFGLLNLFGLNQDLFLKQLINLVIGVIIYFFIRYRLKNFINTNYQFFYYLLFFLLLATFLIGLEVKGSKRWLDLYFFRFQTSEILKPFFILYLSYLFSEKNIFKNNFFLFLKSFFVFIAPFLIIFKQPDLANALSYLTIYFLMLFFSNLSKKHLFRLFFFSSLFLPLVWFFLKDYQKDRLISFFNPHLEKLGDSYNMIQSIITIGSGRFFGKGLGFATQSRLFFLPENNTDFAFASLVEQFGFFGGVIIIIFYAVLIFLLIKKVFNFYWKSEDEDKRKFLYTLGFLVYLSFQFFINVGMNLGILPVAGVALPFISYGGSIIIAYFIGLALLP